MDTLLRMDTEDGEFVPVIESQGERDPGKPASWAYYLSHRCAKYGIPPVLLVVCTDRSTAAWASRQVDIGPPQWPALTLRPLVLGPDSLPVIASPDETEASGGRRRAGRQEQPAARLSRNAGPGRGEEGERQPAGRQGPCGPCPAHRRPERGQTGLACAVPDDEADGGELPRWAPIPLTGVPSSSGSPQAGRVTVVRARIGVVFPAPSEEAVGADAQRESSPSTAIALRPARTFGPVVRISPA
ncbi:hypothetical protein [Streptomyces sp. KMM 9044]|uniref:hypothetical protein n=1 Tax=Streptomyces sp. KMM 9044 TaxID=2744474 RepID=UPI002171E26F